MKTGIRLVILSSILTLCITPDASAQYPPIDIDMEQTQTVDVVNNVEQSQEQSQVGDVFDPRIYPYVRGVDYDRKGLPKTGTDATVLSLYALTLFGIGMVLLRFVDKRRLRAALAGNAGGSVFVVEEAPIEHRPMTEPPPQPGTGFYEGDIIPPPFGS